ncbi:hypothetical protein LCGC14_1395330 [marine sediment metagenome]|uniref:N-acetyltransferase domain-containing protein n=1 Tax=marine sediment metagenome TaxID=412755 RepID=A0A0F9MEA5_9ZZZZ
MVYIFDIYCRCIFLVIRLATEKDIPAITQLLLSCTEDMAKNGMTHWLGVYDADSVAKNMKQKSVYVAVENNSILGCVALGKHKADYYADCWPDAPEASFYLTQLAVSPTAQGQGLGKALVKFCIEKIGNKSLLLDAVDHYPALLIFYKKLGFEIIATGIGLGDKRHLFAYNLN